MDTASESRIRSGDFAILLVLALARLIVHCATNWQYGFHRDELGVLDDARYLDWGYVSYPPFTAFVARVALTLFGGNASLAGCGDPTEGNTGTPKDTASTTPTESAPNSVEDNSNREPSSTNTENGAGGNG